MLRRFLASARTSIDWVLLLAAILIAGLAMGRLLIADGWPHNHEMLSPFERTEGFRRAFLEGDLWPIWTPFAHNGHGSAWPLFYHRLFTSAAAAISLVVGVEAAVKLTILAFLIVGAAGMAQCAKALGAGRILQLTAAALFAFSPYAYFDWLIRGATAEFSAFALIPWLLLCLLRILEGRRSGALLGVTLVLLYHAHIVVFLYCALLFVPLLPLLRREAVRPALQTLLIASAAVALLCVPHALLVLEIGSEFQLGALSMFKPQNEFVPLRRYVWDQDFAWGRTWRGNSVEIGWSLLLALVLVTSAAVVWRVYPRTRQAAFLWLAFLIFIALQLPLAATFYEAVPHAELLQFPWRLIALVLPLTVLLFTLAAQRLADVKPWVGVLFALVAVLPFAWRGAVAQQAKYARFSSSRIKAQLDGLDRPWSAHEYLPSSAGGTVPPRVPFLTSRGCGIVKAEPPTAATTPTHLGVVTARVQAAVGCELVFGQFKTSLLVVEAPPGSKVKGRKNGTTAVTLPPGRSEVTLRRASFLELLRRRL